MKTATPAQCGVRNADLQALLNRFEKRGINTHSILMSRGGKLFFERYWAPFTSETPHRMYSVTKSFVSVAVGQLWAEGKLSLDDPICRYFPDKLPADVHPWLAQQTIRDMLKMCTCFVGDRWFKPGVTDRLKHYFSQKVMRPAGTVFHYDSTGSYVLGCLVERVSGMGLLEYLRKIALDRIGGFENACMLQTPDGTPWGDSALVATPRALMNFASLVMHGGQWEEEQLLSSEYLSQATSAQTDNNVEGRQAYNRYGYGYQFWMAEKGFSFNGMGSQFAICVPERDFVFVCTGDNQLSDEQNNPIIFDTVFDCIVSNLADESLPEEEELPEKELALPVAHGGRDSAFASRISGAWFECSENPMGITRFKLDFSGDEGVFTWFNAQGEKQLPFGLKHNLIGPFPQAGYSDERGNVHEINDFRYRCAVSAGWLEEQKLQLKVQIIDRYFGNLVITFGFRDQNTAGVYMAKCAEDFLDEYDGWMGAERI